MQKSKGFEWSYRDLLLSLMVVYMGMAALALIASSKATTAGVKQGNIMFELTWPQPALADVDLWVRAPGDKSVGYAHPSDRHCNLLRDDLGRPVDPESRNMELVVCRGLPDGEWVADATLYADRDGKLPLSATVKASLSTPSGMSQIARRTVHLVREGDDETAFRFTLRDKKLVPDSINHLPANLWRHPQ
ncbi:MAG: hypothetical protein ACRDNS_13575 [Trebonia sp.]